MNKSIIYVILGILGLGIAYYLLSPLLLNEEKNDVDPFAETMSKTANQEVMNDVMNQMTDKEKTEFLTEMKESMEKPMEEMMEDMPVGPQLLAEGDFIANLHHVDGLAKVIKTEDALILRFEGFDSVIGPNTRVYLSKDRTNKDFIDLGNFKVNRGNININVPEGTDTDVYNHVLIWCKPFSVLFSYAVLN